jgi:hypothetical protein
VALQTPPRGSSSSAARAGAAAAASAASTAQENNRGRDRVMVASPVGGWGSAGRRVPNIGAAGPQRHWRDDVGRAALVRGAAAAQDRPAAMDLRRLAAALLLAAAAPAALADRSRLGEDEDGVEAGDCELEAGVERSRARGAARERETAWSLSCGIGWRSELALAVARQRSGGERVDARALELKTTLVPRRGRAVGWALQAALADERASGASWRRSDYALQLEVTAELRPGWLAEAKRGWARDVPARADRGTWTLGLEHALSDAWEVRAELEGDDREPPLAGASLRWAFWPEVAQVTLGTARRLGGDRARLWGVTLGVEF